MADTTFNQPREQAAIQPAPSIPTTAPAGSTPVTPSPPVKTTGQLWPR
jgi:hypothetical protein